MSDNSPHDPKTSKERTQAESIRNGLLLFLAAVLTFVAVFMVGSIVGTKISAGAGPMNEHHIGNGVATGAIAGIACSLIVAVLLYRKLLR